MTTEGQQLRKYINETSLKSLAEYVGVTPDAVVRWKKIPVWHRRKVIEWIEIHNQDGIDFCQKISKK